MAKNESLGHKSARRRNADASLQIPTLAASLLFCDYRLAFLFIGQDGRRRAGDYGRESNFDQ